MIKTLRNGIQIAKNDYGVCLILTDDLRKSFSSELSENHPGGRWITITDPGSSLCGRHIYILPHSDGTATVLVGGGPALRHKTLTLKRHDEQKPEAAKEEGGEEKPAAKEGEEPQPEPAPEPEKAKPVLTEEQRQEIDDSIKVLSKEITGKKNDMYDFVKEKWGVDSDLTSEDKAKIEKKVQDIENPVERAVAEGLEKKKIMDDKDKALQDIIKGAKAALLDENPSAQGNTGIAAVVKEHAEDLVAMHYAIQQLAKERKDLRKMIRIGKQKDKFRSGAEILASLQPISSDDLKATIADEHALEKELNAHYRLIKKTRGIEGVDGTGDDKLKGDKELQRNIKQGGFETMTGFVGQLAKKAVIRKKVYDELGSQNAALLVKHYLLTSGHDIKQVAGDLKDFITAENNPIAFKANERGAYFMHLAGKVREFGKGSDNIMTVQQALGTSLRYQNKAYEAYGQAEGSLNQAAELLYSLQGRGSQAMEFASAYTDSLDHKRKALGLKPNDVSVKKKDGHFVMTVKPAAFEKMLKEDDTFAHGHGLGLENSPEDIKSMKANTDDFFPAGINAYTPTVNGQSEKVVMRPHEQAAARLIAQQKKAFLNFEAGTGKSKVVLVAKAHLDEVDGTQHKMIVGMPKNLINNFADEVKKWTGYNVIKVHGGISAERRKKLYAQADGNTIVLCTHETFGNDTVAIKEANFGIVVADEAHKITQREGRSDSNKSAGLQAIAEQAKYYVPMTGSAANSDLSELYFHLHVADPETYSSQKEFMSQFGASHKGVGYKQAVKDFLNSQLSNNVYTLKKDIDAPLIHQTHNVKLSKTQEKQYRAVMNEYASGDKGKNSGLARDMDLSYLLNGADHKEGYNFENNAKYDKLKEIIDNHIATKGPDEKIGIYTKYRATLNELQRFIAHHYPQYSHVAFTGTTNKNELDGLKHRVLHDPKTMFSLHMKAGVEGLNLQHSKDSGGLTTMVGIASGEDSYSTLDQFISRGWRTGADKPIHAHTVLTDTPFDMGTGIRLDEKKGIKDLIEEKGEKGGSHKPSSMSFLAKAMSGILRRVR